MRALVLAALLLLALPATALAGGRWYAGDLHVHTTYSHDSYGGPHDDNTGPEDGYALGFSVGEDFMLARTRGLDFLAITDHNDVRSQSDPGFGAAGVLPVRGYENSLRGHAQMLGAGKVYDSGDKSTPAVQSMVRKLRADGGAFQVNHPSDPVWEYGYSVRPDTVEVWNLPRFYQPPLPSSSDNDANLRYWQGWLDRGKRVTAVGGSDSHWRSTSAAQGPGQPTTWVYATERSEKAIVAGLRAGRTFIAHEPPGYGGPRLFLEGDRDRDGRYESLVGAKLPAGTPLRVRALGAPGAKLAVKTDGGEPAFAPVTVTGASFEHRFTLPKGRTWAYAEAYGEDLREDRAALCEEQLGENTTYCRNRIALLAMTSAIYLGAR